MQGFASASSTGMIAHSTVDQPSAQSISSSQRQKDGGQHLNQSR